MTRCLEYYDKYEKEGNFCGVSTGAISQIKAYNEIRKKIELHIKDRAFVVENFPEGACREMLSIAKDDETRLKAINYVIECLKRREKVTGGDLKSTIKGWLQPRTCNVEKQGGNLGHVSKKFTIVNSPTEQKPSLPMETDAPPIAPLKIEPDAVPVVKETLTTQPAAPITDIAGKVSPSTDTPLLDGKGRFVRASGTPSPSADVTMDPDKFNRAEVERTAEEFLEALEKVYPKYKIMTTDILRFHTSWKAKDVLCYGIESVSTGKVPASALMGKRAP